MIVSECRSVELVTSFLQGEFLKEAEKFASRTLAVFSSGVAGEVVRW